MNRRMLLRAALAPAAAAAMRGAGPSIETRAAIPNVCAWLKLQRLEDGTLLAFIFNQPCHGRWEGDLDCWESRDGGRKWRFRSRVAPHEPTTVRMNCATGFAPNGDLLVVCGGWSNKGPVGEVRSGASHVLRPWICRSSDRGRTWRIDKDRFPDPPRTPVGTGEHYYPFGAVAQAADGSLCIAVYVAKASGREAYLLRSRDQGASWDDRVPLNVPGGNETWILHTGKGRWLAAGRELDPKQPGHYLVLLASDDDARTWRKGTHLTLPNQINGNLVRLRDGRILLTFGNRNWGNYGVDARLSENQGGTWSPPFRIASYPFRDCGYPSTVQLPDGSAVTAYYTQLSDDYLYEMRTALWNPSDFPSTGMPAA
jgi:hypothetical protein